MACGAWLACASTKGVLQAIGSATFQVGRGRWLEAIGLYTDLLGVAERSA